MIENFENFCAFTLPIWREKFIRKMGLWPTESDAR